MAVDGEPEFSLAWISPEDAARLDMKLDKAERRAWAALAMAGMGDLAGHPPARRRNMTGYEALTELHRLGLGGIGHEPGEQE